MYPRSAVSACSLFCLQGVLFVATASAQGTTPALEEIVVTASRTQERLANAIPLTTVITSEQIRNSGAPDLPALLSSQASLQVTRNGGAGASGGLFMRGASSNQVLVLIDGVPQTKQDATGSMSLEHLALDQIDRIEIVRGNVSAMYGSGAIGGVVQLFTRQGKQGAQPYAGLALGSQGTRIANAGVTGAHQGVDYALSLSYKKTEGFSAMNTAQNPKANPDKDGYENSSVFARIGYRFNEDHRLSLSTRHNDGRFSFDSSFDTPKDLHTGKTVMQQTRLESMNHWIGPWKSQLSLAKQKERNESNYGGAFAFVDRYTTGSDVLVWDNQIKISESFSIKAGREMQWQALDADNGFGTLFKPKRTTRAWFAGLNATVMDAIQLQANIRTDQFDLDTASTGMSSDSKTTGLLGLGWQITPQWRASAMVSSAYNLAPLGYLYDPNYGNPKLVPEKAQSAELGLQWRAAANSVNLRIFDTRLRDQLEFDPNASAFGTFNNIGRTRNRGAELSANTKMDGVALKASLTQQNPQDETNHRVLNRRAKQLANLGADYSLGAWRFAGDVQYTGPRPDYAVKKQLGGYSVAHLSASYAIGWGVSVNATLRNVFDKVYQTAYGFNAEPRSAIIGVQYRPQ